MFNVTWPLGGDTGIQYHVLCQCLPSYPKALCDIPLFFVSREWGKHRPRKEGTHFNLALGKLILISGPFPLLHNGLSLSKGPSCSHCWYPGNFTLHCPRFSSWEGHWEPSQMELLFWKELPFWTSASLCKAFSASPGRHLLSPAAPQGNHRTGKCK